MSPARLGIVRAAVDAAACPDTSMSSSQNTRFIVVRLPGELSASSAGPRRGGYPRLTSILELSYRAGAKTGRRTQPGAGDSHHRKPGKTRSGLKGKARGRREDSERMIAFFNSWSWLFEPPPQDENAWRLRYDTPRDGSREWRSCSPGAASAFNSLTPGALRHHRLSLPSGKHADQTL